MAARRLKIYKRNWHLYSTPRDKGDIMERMSNYYTSVTRRLLFAFFCLCLVPLLAVGWITKNSLHDINVIGLQDQATATVTAQAKVVSQVLKDHINRLNMLVNLLPPSFFEQQGNTEKLFLAIDNRDDIVDLQCIAANGEQYAYVGPYRAQVEGKSYAEAPWFHETLLNGVHISNVFTGYRGTPHFVVAVTNPLKNYVLRATVNSSSFNSLLLAAQISPHSDAFIVNRAGDFQTPSLRGETTISATVRALISGDGSRAPVVTDDAVYIARPLADGRWFFIIKADVEDSMSVYIPLYRKILIIFTILFILALAAALLVSIMLARHIRHADMEYAADSMQFAQMEKMATIGRLAAGVAHEINNPLQMISSQASWIAELLPEEDPAKVKNLVEYKESVEKIRYHVKRAGTITHRLLGYSKKMAAQQEEVQLTDLLNETISFIEKEAENNEITIHRNFVPNLPPTMTDGPQLQQVFLNLLNNALDAAGEKGEVEISTEVSGRELVIRFADNGPGIARENLKRLFDPFFTTKSPNKGTGLGLYISYDITRKLGGSLKAENRKSGGALFTVRLPIARLGEEALSR
jgi:two-component system NtrC family sensor kinase